MKIETKRKLIDYSLRIIFLSANCLILSHFLFIFLVTFWDFSLINEVIKHDLFDYLDTKLILFIVWVFFLRYTLQFYWVSKRLIMDLIDDFFEWKTNQERNEEIEDNERD